MIITCPHCQTKYQVTFEAIGSAGRKVQCAHCHRAWNQEPSSLTDEVAPPPAADAEGDRLFDAMAEDALDEAMAAEESAAAVQPAAASPVRPVPGADAVEMQKRQVAFKRRQNAMNSSLPMARVRRAARVVGAVVLAGILAGAYFGRMPIVERYPDLAGLYEALGLGVNVVGLDFSNLETLKALSGGNDVLTVSAQIVGRSPTPVPVPPVVVSLLDDAGRAVYEWSVTPRVRDLMLGERATFDTRLSVPPSEAVRVRLSFAGRGASGERSSATEAATGPDASEGGGHQAPAQQADHAAESAHAPAASQHH